MYRVKIGCSLGYETTAATPLVLMVHPATGPRQFLQREEFICEPLVPVGEFKDGFGNVCHRFTLPAGVSRIRYDAVAMVPEEPDAVAPGVKPMPMAELPAEVLRFTLPSRYAETDKLLDFAWQNFGGLEAGWARAQGICDWVHRNIEYKLGSSRSDWSACDAIQRRQGVCRDQAHCVVALCRAFNMPARYAVAYLPDILVPDDDLPMDFHAYAEVYLEGRWWVFDPHKNVPRRGRVFIGSGLDAADVAFATIYGAAKLAEFKVWADPVDEAGKVLDLTLPVVKVVPGAQAGRGD